MALTDFLTQIADAIRSKDGTTDSIVATDFPQRILDIPSGGSELPDTFKTGTFTVAEDTTETITIPHGLGITPVAAFIFPDNPDYAIGKIAYTFMGGFGGSTVAYVTSNAMGMTEKYSTFAIVKDDDNIIITNQNTSYKVRAGLIYRWFAWGMSA